MMVTVNYIDQYSTPRAMQTGKRHHMLRFEAIFFHSFNYDVAL